MAAAVASANKDYAKAAALQQRLLDETISEGSPAEQAMAAYGLGNTLLAAGQLEAAADGLLLTCQLCSEHELNHLAPMAYTNLGVALHRLGDFDHAFAALRVGSAFYRAQGNLPGEAFVCDNLALIYQELGRPEDAARVWSYALGRYDSITNPTMADVREAGRADIAGASWSDWGTWRMPLDASAVGRRIAHGAGNATRRGACCRTRTRRPTCGRIPPAGIGHQGSTDLSASARQRLQSRRRCRTFRVRSRCRRATSAVRWPRSATHKAPLATTGAVFGALIAAEQTDLNPGVGDTVPGVSRGSRAWTSTWACRTRTIIRPT